MSAEWYFQEMGEIIGPLSASQLRRYVTEGKIGRATPVREGVDGNWLWAEEVKGLCEGSDADQGGSERTSREAGRGGRRLHASETADRIERQCTARTCGEPQPLLDPRARRRAILYCAAASLGLAVIVGISVSVARFHNDPDPRTRASPTKESQNNVTRDPEAELRDMVARGVAKGKAEGFQFLASNALTTRCQVFGNKGTVVLQDTMVLGTKAFHNTYELYYERRQGQWKMTGGKSISGSGTELSFVPPSLRNYFRPEDRDVQEELEHAAQDGYDNERCIIEARRIYSEFQRAQEERRNGQP